MLIFTLNDFFMIYFITFYENYMINMGLETCVKTYQTYTFNKSTRIHLNINVKHQTLRIFEKCVV